MNIGELSAQHGIPRHELPGRIVLSLSPFTSALRVATGLSDTCWAPWGWHELTDWGKRSRYGRAVVRRMHRARAFIEHRGFCRPSARVVFGTPCIDPSGPPHEKHLRQWCESRLDGPQNVAG